MKSLKLFISVAATMLALFSCTKEQSSLDFGDIKGKAVILGTLSMSSGMDYVGDKYVENIVPAAKTKVFVDVNNNAFVDGAAGFTTFEGITDENGKYRIEIPSVPAGVQVTVRSEDFVAEYSQITGVDNGTPVVEKVEAIYSLTEKTFPSVKPGNVEAGTSSFIATPVDLPKQFKYALPFKVRVGQGIYHSISSSYKFDRAQNVNVVMTVTYDNDIVRTYAGTTDRNGEWAFDVPVFEEKCNLSNVTIELTPFYTEDFVDASGKHYIGAYRQFNGYDYDAPISIPNVSLDGLKDDKGNYIITLFEAIMLFRGFDGTPYEETYHWNSNTEWL